MTVKEALSQLSTPDLVAIGWLVKMVKDHPEQVKKVLEKHEVSFSKDPLENFNKIISLSGLKQRWFTDDLEEVAKEAHYFSLGGVINSVKGFLGNVAGAVSTVAAPVVTAVTGVPAAGAAASGLLTGISNLLGGGPKGGQQAPAGQAASQPAPPPNIATSPQAMQIASDIKTLADNSKDKDDTELSWWAKNKQYVFIGGAVVLVVVGVIIYMRYQKNKNKSKSH